MNLTVSKDGAWHRFAMHQHDRWTPSTFFPQLDSVMVRIREDLDATQDPRIVFDLSNLETIDSSMITVIVQTIRVANGGTVSVIAPNTDVYAWLKLLGIDRLTSMYETEDQWRAQANRVNFSGRE